jgi:hypothetical protein
MRLNRHAEARNNDRMLRWEHENELVRPYSSFGLITRTQGTSFLRRSTAGTAVVVTPAGTRDLGLVPAGPTRRR